MERDGTYTRWRNRDLDTAAKIVCEECNNGWMSELENRSIPIMKSMVVHRVPTQLQVSDIAVLAAIGFKNAALADRMQTIRAPFFSQSERQLFADDLTLPGGLQMWLATMARQHGLFTSHYVNTPKSGANSFEGHIFTYGAGHLVIQVAAWRWKKKSLRRHYRAPFATQDDRWRGYSAPCWPSDGSKVSWPAPAHLSDKLLYQFINRWSEIRFTVIG